MSFTLFSVVIFVVTAAIIYIHIRWGYKHGMSKSLINVAILFSCAFFASLVAVGITALGDALILNLAKNIGIYQFIEKNLGSFIPAIVVMLKMIISLVLYLPIFFILRIVSSLTAKIIYGIFVKKGSKKKPRYLSENEALYVKKDKKIGALLGIVSGFILSVVIFAPLVGALKTADGIVDILKTNTDIPAIENSKSLELLDKYSNDFSGTVINACGGAVLYDMTTSTSYSGHTTCLNREIGYIESIDLIGTKNKLAQGGGLTVDGIAELEPVLNTVSKSLVLKLMVSEIVKDASASWINRETYMGMERPSIGTHKAMDNFLDQMLYVCSTSTFDTYDADVRTLLNLLKLFQKNEALLTAGDYDTLVYAFTDGGFLHQVEAELDKNPHMNMVSYAINDMIMDVVAEEIIDTSKYSDVARNMLYREIAAALSDTQGLSGATRDNTVSSYLSESFDKFGVDVPKNINDRIASVLSENVPTMDGRVTDKEVKKFIDECVE